MILSEILEQIDILVPNSLPTSIKVAWINQVQRQMFRDYPLPDKIFAFTTEADTAGYSFPADCPIDRVQHLVIDEIEYPYVSISEPTNHHDRYWTSVDGRLLIYPTPTEALTAVLFYRQRPADLSETSLTAEPDFPEDFHEMLVVGCAARVAKVSPETLPLVSMYETDFLRLADRADRQITKYRPKSVRVVRTWE